MANHPNSLFDGGQPEQPMDCRIRLEGQLGAQWADWFDGLAITWDDNGETLLSGLVVDQSALHGLLRKVRDLGIPLRSVVCTRPSQSTGVDVAPSAVADTEQSGGTV